MAPLVSCQGSKFGMSISGSFSPFSLNLLSLSLSLSLSLTVLLLPPADVRMDYQEPLPSNLAAYSPGFHPHRQPHFNFLPLQPQPQQNFFLNPNRPSFDQRNHHHHPYYHSDVTSLPAPVPPPPVETTYAVNPDGGYASTATVQGGDYNAVSGGLPSYYHDPKWHTNARFEEYINNPIRFPYPTSNTLPTNNTVLQFVATSFNHSIAHTRKMRYIGKISARKRLKKTKIPQSVRCDVCKIVCDTEDVLKKHRLGKKHKQNLEKLKAVVAGQTTTTTTSSAATASTANNNSATPTPEPAGTSKSVNAQTKKKKASHKAEDLETKKKRVLEGGAATDAVRTCSICKVVCNSETVFQYHLGGQKHAAMVKKQASGTATQTASAPAS